PDGDLQTRALDAGDHHATRVLPALAESALDEDMTDVIDTRAATHRGDRRPAARPAVPIGPLAVDPAPADRHPGRGSR
ncbi:serine/threonine-protein kinase, partial [Xanthomonas citri pv. citri]|nr:serine/threonine-protein kinase [Xanthomonas citri pv. citri]